MGRLDIAVNNAGAVGGAGPFGKFDVSEFSRILELNVVGTARMMEYELSLMSAGASIVNVSSNIGVHGRRPSMGGYAASKAAVSVLTRNAALDVIDRGIRINAVSPGATDTPLSYRPGDAQ